jgi:hypothetical protein
MTSTGDAVAGPSARTTGAAPPASATVDDPNQPGVAGRLALIAQEEPRTALPDDVDLDRLLAQIQHGGRVVVCRHPDGPPVSTPGLHIQNIGTAHIHYR